jgi:GMP synthase-like glutamine amidotransferase
MIQVVEATFGEDRQDDNENRHCPCRALNFAMLGCESQPPYGPLEHTANLFLHLVGQAALGSQNEQSRWKIGIHVYNAQAQEYPQDDAEWNSYDGILIPGSFSAAYDTQQPWIARLLDVIQQEIVTAQRPTLAICFGHQVMAHSFRPNGSGNNGGRAIPTPSGPRAGRYAMPLTVAGTKLWLQGNNVDTSCTHMYFTHGDMVEQLPQTAVTLGGTDQIPVQAAAYFAAPHDVEVWSNPSTSLAAALACCRPFAITLQAHPEYAAAGLDLGVNGTLFPCLESMTQRGGISQERQQKAMDDALSNFTQVQRDSIESIAAVGRILGWFI